MITQAREPDTCRALSRSRRLPRERGRRRRRSGASAARCRSLSRGCCERLRRHAGRAPHRRSPPPLRRPQPFAWPPEEGPVAALSTRPMTIACLIASYTDQPAVPERGSSHGPPCFGLSTQLDRLVSGSGRNPAPAARARAPRREPGMLSDPPGRRRAGFHSLLMASAGCSRRIHGPPDTFEPARASQGGRRAVLPGRQGSYGLHIVSSVVRTCNKHVQSHNLASIRGNKKGNVIK